MKLAELFVEIATKNAGLASGLAQARSQITSFAKTAGRQLGSLAIGVTAGALGGAGIAGGLLAAAKKAANLGESISKVQVTFGSAAQSMIDQSDQLAARFGTVKQETLDAAASFGLMGKAARMSTADSAALGKEFVQLGLDLASYHNISNQEAFLKLRSGLAGEAEPLRPLGIMLSEDAVKAEALATGLIKTKRELTDQEKILARILVIRRQMGSAIGDLARTEGSTANQMRKLQGEIENAAVEFGKNLEGAMLQGLKLAHEFAAVIKAATGKEASEAFGETAKAGVVVTRQAVQGAQGPGDVAVNAALMAVRSYNLTMMQGLQAIGLNMIPGFREHVDTLRREMEEIAAKTTGEPLAVQGRTQAQIAQDKAKAQKDKDLADNARLRAATDAQRARENAAINTEIVRGRVMGFVHRVQTKVAGAFGAMPEEAGGKVMGIVAPLAALLTPGGRAQAVSRLAGLGAERADAMKKIADIQKEQKPFQAQQFGGPAEFGQFAIQQALSDQDEQPKKEQLDEANKNLQEIEKRIRELYAPLAKIPGMGAILRGAS